MNDRTLFDVDRTTTKVCLACYQPRFAGEDKVKACMWEKFEMPGKRPKDCLNRHDPAHAPFPEGY